MKRAYVSRETWWSILEYYSCTSLARYIEFIQLVQNVRDHSPQIANVLLQDPDARGNCIAIRSQPGRLADFNDQLVATADDIGNVRRRIFSGLQQRPNARRLGWRSQQKTVYTPQGEKERKNTK